MIQNYQLQHKQQKLPSLQTAEPIKQTIKNLSYSKKKKKTPPNEATRGGKLSFKSS